MDAIELSEPERDAISALLTTRRDRPEADCYVHDGRSVRMLGAAEDVSLWIGRESLRSLATASWSGSIVTGAAVARERMVDVNTACGTDRAARRTRMRRIPLRRSLDGFAEFSE